MEVEFFFQVLPIKYITCFHTLVRNIKNSFLSFMKNKVCLLLLMISWIGHEERQHLYFFSELIFFGISRKIIYETDA